MKRAEQNQTTKLSIMSFPQAPSEAMPPSSDEQRRSVGDEAEFAILPSQDEVLACQFSSWYPLFSRLDQKYRGRSNVTIKSVILDLPEQFVHYLDSDQLILPAGTRTSSALLEHHQGTDPEWSSDDNDDDDNNKDDAERQDESEQSQLLFSFPALDQAIADAFLELQCEAVTPKLNWSAPRDAVWVNAGTLECRTAGDIYLLLKASDFCAHDVHHALTDVLVPEPAADTEEEPPTLVQPPKLQLALRKWCNLYPSQEFRCFVSNRTLLAISQRHHSQHWPHLVREQAAIRDLLRHFVDGVVRDTLSSSASSLLFQLQRYVLDVYIDKKQRVWLLDINVWATRTDALLFDWTELTRLAAAAAADNRNENELPIVRVVETSKQVRADPLASYKAPIDTLHVASAGNSSNGEFGVGDNNSNNKFQEFMSMCKRPGSASSDSSSSEDCDSDEGDCA